MIHYFSSSPDDLPRAPLAFADDEESGWWVGIQKCGAQLALSAALLLASSTAALATQVFSFHQDDPKLSATPLDEQTWTNQVAPYVAPNVVPFPWQLDEQTPALTTAVGYLDEQAWANPVPPVPYYIPPQFISDDQVIGQPAGQIFDDNEVWQNQIAPVWGYPVPIVFTIDEAIPAGKVSQIFWLQ